MRTVKTDLLKSRRRLRKAWQFLTSYLPSRGPQDAFAHVRTFCLFIGYPRSGHTLVGSVVDAHPNAIIANELNVVGHVKRGFSRAQIYALILANSRAFARSSREWTGYSYEVRTQWQGRFSTLEVIGDKRGAGTVRQLRTNPGLLDRLGAAVGPDLRFIHVVRNPLDNVSTISRRHGWPLPKAIEYYFGLCRAVMDLRNQMAAGAVLDVWHEDLIARPADGIRAICGFLGLEPHPDYVRDCAAIVFPEPKQTRTEIEWPSDHRAAVHAEARGIPWLRRYADEA